VGRVDAKQKQDIQLMGPGIASEHCAFYMKNNYVCVSPIKEAKFVFTYDYNPYKYILYNFFAWLLMINQ
jgi:hypothetical protein